MGTLISSRFCLLFLLVFCICLSWLSVTAQDRRPKTVQVALRAKWSGTPLLFEAGELLSKEWKDLFWNFVESWIHSDNADSELNFAKVCLNKIVKYGRSLLTEPLASVFEFSLTLRSASPRLVLCHQLAEESLFSFPLNDDVSANAIEGGKFEPNETTTAKSSETFLLGMNPNSHGNKCCWVDTGRSIFFDGKNLQSWLQNPISDGAFQQPEIFEFDHIHPESSAGGSIAILYGALGTECFKEFHMALSEASRKGKVRYIVRSVLPSGCESKSSTCGAIGTGGPLHLAGYGVELALKNMEYKAMDDSIIKKGATLEDPNTEDLSQEVRGFIFSQILVSSLTC